MGVASGVERLQREDRPTLQVIRRLGDPSGALAVALFPSGGSRDVVLLRSLFELRLRGAGLDVEASEHSLGLVLTVLEEQQTQRGEDLAEVIFARLHEPVGDEEANTIAQLDPVGRLAARGMRVSPLGMCEARLGSEGKDALDGVSNARFAAELERIRASSLVASRVGLSVVGSPSWIARVKRLQARDWNPSPPLIDAWDATPATSVQEWGAARELSVALRVGASSAALAAARSLRNPTHPLRTRLAAVSARTRLEEVDVTLRPAGACLSLRVSIESLPARGAERALAELSVVALQELRSELDRTWSEDERTLALLSPTTSKEAAALAAWTAVRSATTGSAEKRLVEYRGPKGDAVSSAGLADQVEETMGAWEGRSLPALARSELGQSQLWVLVASPCGARAEAVELAGQRMIFLRTLARQWSGRQGVQLQPWVDARGSGLVGHGPALRGEAPEAHARRVARVLGSALFGAPVDGRILAEVRSGALAVVGSDPGRDLLATVVGGEHAAMLQPGGSDVSVAGLAAADIERERDEFVREPLRLAALENGAPGQADAAADSLGQWLAAVREHPAPCPATRWEPADAGQWTLETIDDGVLPSARIGVPLPVRPELGRALVQVLEAHLENASLDWWGGAEFGALVVRVTSATDLHTEIERIRLRLHELSESPPSLSFVERVLQQGAAKDRALLRFPAARVVRLWLDESAPIEATAEELIAQFPALNAGRHRIVRVQQRGSRSPL